MPPDHLSLVLQEPLQIEVFCRSEIRLAPKAKKHRAFEDESFAMGRYGKTIKKSLEPVPDKYEVWIRLDGS